MTAALVVAAAATDAFDAAIRSWGQQFNWPAEPMLRLLLAAAAGGLVGLEREIRGRQAGFRTNMLVCVGCALVMLVSVAFTERHWPHEGNFNVNVDPARIAYGVMAGIGFLGAGTIIKHEVSVRGLTTAAAMWCVAAIGLAAGFGMYTLTAAATGIVLASLWLLDMIENALPRVHYRALTLRRPWARDAVDDALQKIKIGGVRVSSVSFHRTADLAEVDIQVRIAFTDKQLVHQLARLVEDQPNWKLMAYTED
jgi:putative Mg2+ transporter-C (MgtC) family protein